MNQNLKNIPADGFAGLKQNFSKDALAGFLVFLLAMPLSLGIAKASQFPMIFGIVTAIVGGILVSFFMGSRLSIKGPAAGLIVIAAGAVSAFGDGEIGWRLSLGAIVVAGLIQILFGVLKMGKLADFFPGAAIHGMLAAIGIIIMSKQIHLLMGIDPSHLKGKDPLELLAMIPSSIMHENAHLAEIGFACLLIMVLMSFVKNKHLKKIPPPLIVLVISIPLGYILHIKTDKEIANFSLVKIGSIFDAFKDGLIHADFSGMSTHTGVFIEYVILFSLIGTIESLLTAKAMDGLDPWKRKTDFNKDLIAVGIGNTITGLLGGLPMISEVARSSANIANGARTRWANFFHGLFLLIAVVFAVQYIEMIPGVALSAMLVFVGFRLAHPKNFTHSWHVGKEQFLIFTATVIVTISTDLLMGVGSGVLLEFIVNMFHGAKFNEIFSSKADLSNTGDDYTLKIKGPMLFTNIIGYKKKIEAVPQGKNLVIDVSEAHIADHTSLLTVNDLMDRYHTDGGKAELKGFDDHRHLSHSPNSTKVLKKQ